jgi:hypothetical protein
MTYLANQAFRALKPFACNLLFSASFDEPAESQNFRRIYEGVAIGNARYRLRLTLRVPAVLTTLFVSGKVNASSLAGST